MKSLAQFIQESSIGESYDADQAKKELKAAAMKRFATMKHGKRMTIRIIKRLRQTVKRF